MYFGRQRWPTLKMEAPNSCETLIISKKAEIFSAVKLNVSGKTVAFQGLSFFGISQSVDQSFSYDNNVLVITVSKVIPMLN